MEFDGGLKYRGKMPAAEVLLQERQCERALQEAGWTFLRLDVEGLEWKDLSNDAALKARVLAAMAEAPRRQAAAA